MAETKKKTNGKSATAKSSGNKGCKANSKCASKISSKNECCTEAARDCKLTDYDVASDVLGCQKSLIKLYTTSLCEIDCEQLRDLVSCQLDEAAEEQLDVFLYMADRGMYKTENATLQKVKAARAKFEKAIK